MAVSVCYLGKEAFSYICLANPLGSKRMFFRNSMYSPPVQVGGDKIFGCVLSKYKLGTFSVGSTVDTFCFGKLSSFNNGPSKFEVYLPCELSLTRTTEPCVKAQSQ